MHVLYMHTQRTLYFLFLRNNFFFFNIREAFNVNVLLCSCMHFRMSITFSVIVYAQRADVLKGFYQVRPSDRAKSSRMGRQRLVGST